MALTNRQKESLYKEIADIVVNHKSRLILCMNKSGISTVTKENKSTVIVNQIVENLVKNETFAKNLASLITDINLANILEQKELNSSGTQTSENVGANFGKKMENAIIELSKSISDTKADKEKAKNEIKIYVDEAEKNREYKLRKKAFLRRLSMVNGIGGTLTVVGGISLIVVGYYALKEL